MNKPCPDHLYFGNGILKGFSWVISLHGYANIIKSEGDEVHGVIHKISEADELNLDKYESILNLSHQKEMMNVMIDKTNYKCLVYIHPNKTIGLTKGEYLKQIASTSNSNRHQTKPLRGYIPPP